MELQTNLSMTLALSQQMQQSLKILQMNVQDLYKYLSETLLDNPAADLSFLDHRPEPADIVSSRNHSSYQSTEELLLDQIPPSCTPPETDALHFLIKHLSPRGFLPFSIEELASFSNYSEEELGHALSILRAMEPPGIGAMNVQECLLLQLDRLSSDTALERTIIIHHLKELAAGNIRSIAVQTSQPYSRVVHAVAVIKKLNPIPTNGIGREVKADYITPEVIIQHKNGCMVVLPHALNSCSISLTPGYREILERVTNPTEKQYLMDQLSELRSIQYGVMQRQNTIARITEEIVRIQNDFFLGRSNFLQPLSLEDMAKTIGVVPSTVSRAIQGKYLICPSGTFPYKFFFSRKLPSSHEDTPQSASMLLQAIKTCVEEESPEAPWSDQQICDILKEKGIRIARRTVSKYREKLGIPVTYLRRVVSPRTHDDKPLPSETE